MFKHILCPIDGSDASVEALDTAVKLAVEQHASLTICTVVDPGRATAMALGAAAMTAACYDALEEEATQALKDAAARAAGETAVDTIVLHGHPISAIIDCAAACSCDLIVMGSHGRNAIQRLLLGSVAEGIVRHAGVPVMVVRWWSHAKHEEKRSQPAPFEISKIS